MPSSFRSRLTRRHAPTTTPSSASASVYASSASAAVGYAGDAYGNSYSGRSFLGRRSIGGGGSNRQKQQPSQQSNINSQQRGQNSSSSNYTITNPLATFDACIEACDALAASSASSPWQAKQQQPSIISITANDSNKVSSENDDEDNNGIILSSNEKPLDYVASGENYSRSAFGSTENQNTHSSVEELVPDCSVLVSPDGALLFTSSLSTLSNQNNISRSNNNSNRMNLLNDSDNSAPHGGTKIAGETDAESQVEQRHDVALLDDNDRRYPWTQISPENCDGAILSEEYESAVITGNDLTPNGDYDSNGFSATGWDMDAATVALSSSRDVLAGMSNFLETLATCRKQEAICVRAAVETLGDVRVQLERRYYERRRMGPMVLSETKLSAAIEAMEEYYVQSSDCELERWKMACSSSCSSSPLQARTSSSVEPRNELHYSNDNERVDINYDANCGRRKPSELIYGMLPQLQTATTKATSRTLEREHALSDMRSKLLECETILREQKVWASSQWKRVAEEESNIDRLYAIKKMEQHEFYEGQRRKKLLQEEEEGDGVEGASSSVHHSTNEVSDIRIEEEEPLSKEVWMMVQNVTTSMEDFGHTGYSPKARTRKAGESSSNSEISSQRRREQQLLHQQSSSTPSKIITRADVERESEIQDLKMVAQAADEAVEDAAGKLLNTMSKGDTTLRSARLAAESCLLSECNAARNCLRSLVAVERASLQDRLRQLDILEKAVNEIDVRKDIDNYIKSDKAISGGWSRDGEEDGGGIAAALAVLNSHGENSVNANSPRKYRNIERPSYFEGWAEPGGDGEAEGDDDEVEPEIFGEVINMLFGDCPTRDSVAGFSDEQCIGSGGSKDNPTRHNLPPNDSKIETASNALRAKQGSNHRKSILYELNNQRSKKTWVEGRANFDALCRLFDAFLSGCGREPSDVSNAMMLMILSQTFYIEDRTCDEGNNHGKVCDDGSSTRRDRKSRIYVKSTICHHEIWNDEDFWDQAVYQCVSESLSKSGVLMNYVKLATDDENYITGRQPRCIKWHDLSPDEYAVAATQVHSVLFAQLGTLSREYRDFIVIGYVMSVLLLWLSLFFRISIRLDVRIRVRHSTSM